MKSVAYVLLALGIVWLVYALNMETAVSVGEGVRIHNQGLLANRLNNVILASVTLVIGAILFVGGKLRQSPSDTNGSHTQQTSLPPVAIAIGALFFVGLIGLMLYGVSRSGRPDRDSLPSALIGKQAPAFSLPVLHDPNVLVTDKQLRGAPYVLNVWGSWCPTCRDEHPILTRFAETKRVRMIGYNWKDSREDALRWLEQLGNPYMVVLADEEGRTALDWGIAAAPETFLVDGSGTVRWKYSGAITQQVMDQQLIPALEKVEAEIGGRHTAPDLGTAR